MPPPITNTFKFLGVTPMQVITFSICVGSWWATVHPLPAQLVQLNATVQQIATKVEVHSVLLQSVNDMRADVQQMRRELSTIEGRLASHPDYATKP